MVSFTNWMDVHLKDIKILQNILQSQPADISQSALKAPYENRTVQTGTDLV